MGSKSCRTWRKGAADRRDERNVKDAELDKPMRPAHHKDKKKWCGGKVGREHDTACMLWNELHKNHIQNLEGLSKGLGKFYRTCRILVCRRCGKELAWYYGGKGLFADQKKPDWVDK